MSAAECVAWFVGTWLAIGITAAWIKHRLQQRAARARQQREQRIAEVNARLRRGRPTPQRSITLADIQALDNQLADLDQIADRIQPLYLAEEGK